MAGDNRTFPSWEVRMELVLRQKQSALLCRLSSWTPQPLLPTSALPLAIKALCSRAHLVQAAGRYSLALPPLELQGKNAANKTPLSTLPACHIQAVSLLLAFLSLFFFSSSSARQIPREAEAGDGLALPGSRLGNGEARECVLAGPCAGLLQRVATHLCTDLTVFLKPTAFFSAVAQELMSKPSHPLWVLKSLPYLLHQTPWGSP